MASMIVEDGTGHTDSNSYVTIAEADAYWELRNDATWAALTDDQKTAALVQAAQYLDYSYRWVGDRYSTIQAMSWPRVVFFDRDFRAMHANVIPTRIKDAQCELAREASIDGLAPSMDRSGRIQSESVGPLSVTYFPDASGEKEYPLVERLIADLITGESAGSITSSAILA
jgi:hypothetical protein